MFIDIDSIPLGRNYKQHIDEALQKTDFLLVIVGKQWLGQRPDGTHRMNDLNDPVWLELEAAMRYQRLIIPILVDGGVMPGPNELPEPLQDFSFINAAEIESGRSFESQINSLTRFLDDAIADQEGHVDEVAHHAEQARLAEEAAHRSSPLSRLRSAETGLTALVVLVATALPFIIRQPAAAN